MPADWRTAVTQLRGGLNQGRFMTTSRTVGGNSQLSGSGRGCATRRCFVAGTAGTVYPSERARAART